MIREAIGKLTQRQDLSFEEASEVMEGIMEGRATDAQIGGFLTALRIKGETPEEIAGCAQAMRSKALPLQTNQGTVVDTCGTGGDGMGTFNISTTVAFVVAGAGLTVAKHGNRSVSSKSGSADVLEALGVKITLTPQEVAQTIEQSGIGFLYAPIFHQSMKYALGPRKEIGIRSIFNVLGPLTNPARANYQVMGVYEPGLTEPVAQVLDRLGGQAAYVVHGAGGLDEISTLGPTRVTELKGGTLHTYQITPQSLGFPQRKLAELKGGDARDNAAITRQVLTGQRGAHREIVVLNAAAAFKVTGWAKDLAEGVALAEETIDSGQAYAKLEQLIEVTNSYGGQAL